MRLIDADLVHRAKFQTEDLIYKRGWNDALDGVAKCAPTVDAVPVRHGKWIYKDDGCINCSECGADMPFKYYYGYTDWISNYCPQCGARMDKE